MTPIRDRDPENGWTRVVFGDVVQLSRTRSANPAGDGYDRYVGLEHIEPNDLTIRRWGRVTDGTTFTSVFHSGQTLFGKRRAYQRKVAVADFDGVCSGDIYVLETKDPRLLPGLLPFICQTQGFFDHAVGTSAGSLSPRTNWDSLATYEFALPPLDEQQRIVALVSALDQNLGACADLTASVQRLASSLIWNAVAGQQERVLVGGLVVEPPTNGLSPSPNSEARGLRTVSISAVKNGLFDPAGCIKYVDLDAESARRFFVRRDDVFVVRGNGNRQLAGRAGLSERTYSDLIYPDLLIRLRFDSSRILPRFAVRQWNLPVVHGRLSTRAKSSNGIWKVNGRDIREHTLTVPPLATQERVLRDLDVVDAVLNGSHERAQQLRAVKSMVLGRLAAVQ